MSHSATAVVYCEGNFGRQDGKTAHGLVRHSGKYEILSVIDSTRAGADAGVVLGDAPSGIPVVADLAAAVAHSGLVPDTLIFGMAPADGLLDSCQRTDLLAAITAGMNLVSGLHEFLGDDAEFVAAALLADVTITDVRRTKDKKDLRLFTGEVFAVTCPVVAVLGTDGAIGKRTTTTLLVDALLERGIRAVMVGTGQTALIQGARYAVALDATVPQFCSGEVEGQVVAAYENETPDIIVVEGQGALSHPAYLTSAYILRGARPDGVIVQHAPGRVALGDYPAIPMPTVASEIALIESFAQTKVIGVTINHENLSDEQIGAAIDDYELEFGVPATDPLTRPVEHLTEIIFQAYPTLRERAKLRAAALAAFPTRP